MDTANQEKKKIEIDDISQGELIVYQQLSILKASTHGDGTQIFRAYYEGKEYALKKYLENIEKQHKELSENKFCSKLKAVLRDSIETHLQLEHLMNERNALRELSHPGINKMVDTIKDNTHLYFLLEIVYGLPLHKLLQMRSKLSKSYVQLITSQVTQFEGIIKEIEYMHSQGYVYRDLKASNIIVNQHGKTTIIDLGYIKKIENELTNSFCGTIHMIAPELYNDNLEDQGYSYSVDIYSIGILLYELSTGAAPFGYNENDCKAKILVGLTQEIINKIKDDKDLVDLVTKLLDVILLPDQYQLLKDPLKRPKIGDILLHPYYKNVDMHCVEQIMNGNHTNLSQEQLNKFEIFAYQEDINDFGLWEAPSLTEEEKQINEKLNNIFSNF